MNPKIKRSTINAIKPLYKALPVTIGVILLISLITVLIPKTILSNLFQGNAILDTITASFLGSIFAGNPINSYILGGEFLNLGISLVAITAFLVSWVTVGIIQLPAEIMMLGKKFSITRNVLSFVFSIIVAIITVSILNII